jgi:hypothetical protein
LCLKHGITYDPRVDKLAVSDRENHRIEFFDFDAQAGDKFDYTSTINMSAGGAKNGIFLSVFPMFVPSLSWQNDRFYK